VSLGQRLERLEESVASVLPAAPLEPSTCVGCGAHLAAFIKPYGPPDWHTEPSRCDACQAMRTRRVLVAMEEAGFTPAWGIRCLARDMDITEGEVLARASASAGPTSRLDEYLARVACTLGLVSIEPAHQTTRAAPLDAASSTST
jgi:hypothetical protein